MRTDDKSSQLQALVDDDQGDLMVSDIEDHSDHLPQARGEQPLLADGRAHKPLPLSLAPFANKQRVKRQRAVAEEAEPQAFEFAAVHKAAQRGTPAMDMSVDRWLVKQPREN